MELIQCCYTTQGQTHLLALLLLEQLANIHWFDIDVSTPIKSQPHKFNYCNLFFAMLSALAKFAKEKLTENNRATFKAYSIMLLCFA